jgi:hypothetical protein
MIVAGSLFVMVLIGTATEALVLMLVFIWGDYFFLKRD